MKFWLVEFSDEARANIHTTSRKAAMDELMVAAGMVKRVEVKPDQEQVLAWLARIAELEARVAELEGEE